MSLNATPSANRLHIGIFGKVNSGKSTFLNTFTGQKVSIVSDVAGTTTDVVTKAMEIAPLGPCVFIDTAGFDDTTELGEARTERTRQAVEKCDMAILMIADSICDAEMSSEGAEATVRGIANNLHTGNYTAEHVLHTEEVIPDLTEEREWYQYLTSKKIPVVVLVNKVYLAEECDRTLKSSDKKTVCPDEKRAGHDVKEDYSDKKAESSMKFYEEQLRKEIYKLTKEAPIFVNAKTGEGMDVVKEALVRKMPENFELPFITGDLVKEGDVVLLVMPQDAQAPKGRLILPQVQTIRELLDKRCIVVSVTPEKMKEALIQLMKPPKLIITDSQVFKTVYEWKPEESMLTSFSVLFAAYKGDLPYYVEGAKAIDSLNEKSKVLIAECCTHAPLTEDIGRVKIPNMLRKRYGAGLSVDIVSGTDFPQDLSGYDLIIQCGGCMFNRRYIMSRIDRAKGQSIPMTNYGVTIAHLTGILDKISY